MCVYIYIYIHTEYTYAFIYVWIIHSFFFYIHSLGDVIVNIDIRKKSADILEVVQWI